MAAVDYFLKIDGIQGESQDDKHKNEIHLDSWSFGESNAGTFSVGGGGGAGKVQMQDFHFVKRVDKAGPKLFLRRPTPSSSVHDRRESRTDPSRPDPQNS